MVTPRTILLVLVGGAILGGTPGIAAAARPTITIACHDGQKAVYSRPVPSQGELTHLLTVGCDVDELRNDICTAVAIVEAVSGLAPFLNTRPILVARDRARVLPLRGVVVDTRLQPPPFPKPRVRVLVRCTAAP